MMARRKAQEEQGFFTIWVLGMCAIVFLMGNIGIDLWHLYADRRDLAQIADSAAIAAASNVDLSDGGSFKTSSIPTLNTAAATDAASRYVAAAVAQDNITLSGPPVITFAKGAKNQDNGEIDVTLEQDETTAVTRILSGDNYTIKVVGAAQPAVGGDAAVTP